MRKNGFSLLEVLTIIAILSLLVCLVYPNYSHYLIHARRKDGQIALFDLATRLENFYMLNHSYLNATIAGNSRFTIKNDPFSTEKWYILTISKQTATTFKLAAIPISSQIYDTTCQTLTLDYNGTRDIMQGPLGIPTGTANVCW